MPDYSRPASAERFRFEGIKTNSSPDSISPHKYPIAVNVRGVGEHSAQSRSQLDLQSLAPVGGSAVLALEPALGISKQGGSLVSSGTVLVAGTVIDTGYDSGQGASILTFRPNASPNAYDYVFDDSKQSKVFIDPSGVATVQKIGIAEPQTSPEACVDQFNVFEFTGAAADWTNAGTAGALSDQNRVTDTALAFFADPASVAPSLTTRYSMQVGSSQYQVGEVINVAKSSGGTVPMVVQDVYPVINTQSSVSIQAIYYFSGSTGRCAIVLSQMPIDNTVPDFEGANPVAGGSSVALISTLRRGSLITLSPGGGNAETVFVLSVTSGPQGGVCIEVVTANNHVALEKLIGVPALAVSFSESSALLLNQAITDSAIQSAVTVGTGTISKAIAAANNPFTHQPFVGNPDLPTAQQEDYIHLSLKVSDPTLITEIRIYFDVNNGAADFTSNCFYFAVRQSDLASAASGAQSQLAASQLSLQRSLIDQRTQMLALGSTFNPLRSAILPNVDGGPLDLGGSSDQTSTGTSQWSEIMFPVLAMTRVGNDETRTLANTQAVEIQVICTNTVTVQLSNIWVGAGGQPDIGSNGNSYFYRVVPRSSVTGVRGNPSPSMRYGVAPRRQKVILSLPSAAFDSQIDTWDIHRMGGSISGWRYVGSVASTSATYSDNVFDSSITQNPILDFSDLQPFPSIGPPISAISATVTGTVMVATFSDSATSPALKGTLSQLGSLLPGNLFNIGPQVFTLFTRPTLVSTAAGSQTYLFRFVENAANLTNPLVLLQEPTLAAQTANSVWGPDANGIFFAVMVGAGVTSRTTGLRPGIIQWTNPNNPDSSNDGNTSEISVPTEALINGALLGPTPFVASSRRWWRGYHSVDDKGNARYSWNEAPVGAGLAADFGICSDGQHVYFVAKDGIRRHAGGQSQSLTDDDLYNLFPHEGLFPQNVTYLGQTVFAPEYAYAASMRLAVINGFLYFDYLDSGKNRRTLTCDLRRIAWCVDRTDDPAYPQVTIHAGTGLPASNFGLPASGVKNQQLFIGGTDGGIYVEKSAMILNSGEKVTAVLATREEMFGDIRANKQFGDASVDLLAASGNVSITPVLFGALFGTVTTIIGNQTVRPSSPPTINLLGQQLARSMGLLFSWTDFGVSTILYSWQPSYLTQPEDVTQRFTDWDSAGSEGNKFWQGFEIEVDSANVLKTFKVRDSESQSTNDFTSASGTNQIQANGQQIIACSFNTPFIAHLVRIEPQDNKIWRVFRVRWVTQPTPESALTWATQPTSFGLEGYIHSKEVLACYASTADVTLTITCFDGLNPAAITLPNTGGAVKKVLVPLAPNKGLLYTFAASSTAPWRCYADAWEFLIKQWGTSGPYQRYKGLGGAHGDQAKI